MKYQPITWKWRSQLNVLKSKFMIGVTIISKPKLLAPNHPWNSQYFSGVIGLYNDEFLHVKAIMLARSVSN